MSEHPLAQCWAARRSEGRAALVAYVTAGYPTAEVAIAALRAAERAGADVIEVGVPFSDPIADGPTIQRATHAALAAGTTVAGTLALVRAAGLRVPVVLMTYVNPVLAYGVERFLADAVAAGASGLLLTDVPAGAAPELETAVLRSAIALVPLVAPTTPDGRIASAARDPRGFLYFISRLGVTGVRTEAPPDLERHVRRIRSATTLPVAVGFGIATPAQAAAAAGIADGVVVGSALVDALEAGGVARLEQLVGDLARAVHGVPVRSAA